ncbi:hypothetical protein ABZ508_34255 [Streptomyces lavendulocolor]|uniref:Uncharacterized protein n=1 Tax=Streptomyces lavendulocolor TaxID=67316 RepID=A0ABV2WGF7_9ACTN
MPIKAALPTYAGTAADRPRLYHVAPGGLPVDERAQARQEATELRATWPFPGYDEDSPGRAGFNVGLAYGLWAVDPLQADTLASLAYHLTRHTMSVIRTHRYIVTAALVEDRATVSVLALSGRTVEETDPGTNAEVRRLAEKWGGVTLAAGPCLYAAATVTP